MSQTNPSSTTQTPPDDELKSPEEYLEEGNVLMWYKSACIDYQYRQVEYRNPSRKELRERSKGKVVAAVNPSMRRYFRDIRNGGRQELKTRCLRIGLPINRIRFFDEGELALGLRWTETQGSSDLQSA